jgi:predicted nucleic acid-binding protein
MGFLIDTCIWIDVERGTLAPGDIAGLTYDEPIYLSPITIAELKYGAEMASTAHTRQSRLAALARLKRKAILPIDEITGEIFGSLAAQLKILGGQVHYRTQDLWLAAQAIQHNHHLLTHNRKDFQDIPGLNLVIWK